MARNGIFWIDVTWPWWVRPRCLWFGLFWMLGRVPKWAVRIKRCRPPKETKRDGEGE